MVLALTTPGCPIRSLNLASNRLGGAAEVSTAVVNETSPVDSPHCALTSPPRRPCVRVHPLPTVRPVCDLQALSDVLRVNSTLSVLDLSDNCIGGRVAKRLAAALAENGALLELNLQVRALAPRRPASTTLPPITSPPPRRLPPPLWRRSGTSSVSLRCALWRPPW